ncbi:MAG: hypothetical protein ACI8PZ_005073 [Myxococcota bacterium]|jgi:hypothetical protein
MGARSAVSIGLLSGLAALLSATPAVASTGVLAASQVADLIVVGEVTAHVNVPDEEFDRDSTLSPPSSSLPWTPWSPLGAAQLVLGQSLISSALPVNDLGGMCTFVPWGRLSGAPIAGR